MSKNMNRRDFLKTGSLVTTGSLLVDGLPASALVASGPQPASTISANGHAPLEAARNPTGEPESLRRQVSLDGEWRFQLDPSEIGQTLQWHSKPEELKGTITVPGCWQAQGYGQPTEGLTHDYVGAAWYVREVSVPQEWGGKTVVLTIGGASYETAVYVNGGKAGQDSALTVPCRFDLTSLIQSGAVNVVALRITNGIKVPVGCGNWAANWGGLYRSVRLEAHEPIHIASVAIRTDVANNQVTFRALVRNDSRAAVDTGRVDVLVSSRGDTPVLRASGSIVLPAESGKEIEIQMAFPDGKAWTPEEPNLYRARLVLYNGDRALDDKDELFGLREIRCEGNKLLLNGRPFYVRGYVDCSEYVLEGTAPVSKDVHLERVRIAKALGFNAVRYHSWTPTQEFFEAADELGLIVMAELPVYNGGGYLVEYAEFLKNEMRRVIETHRNHPSWISLAMGNEITVSLRVVSEAVKVAYTEMCREFVELGRQLDPTRPMLSNDGFLIEPTDIASLNSGYSSSMPTIKHEFGVYYSSLPDVDLIGRFTGVVKPRWLNSVKKELESRGLLDRYPDYLLSSMRLQQLGRKSEIESLRRLEQFIGYHHFLITDYHTNDGPHGGAWNEGWLNFFWETKDKSLEQSHEFNAGLLPLIGLKVSDRTMWAEEVKPVVAYVSNYGTGAIVDGTLEWEMRHDQQRIGGGSLKVHAPFGVVTEVGEIRLGNYKSQEARQCELVIKISDKSQSHTNRWDIWTFPRGSVLQKSTVPVFSQLRSNNLERFFPFVQRLGTGDEPSSGVLIADDLSTAVTASLEKGGRVLVLADQLRFDPQSTMTYFPPMSGGVGIAIQDHPALRGFPHDGFPDLQFYNLLQGASNFGNFGAQGITYTFKDPIISGLGNYEGDAQQPMPQFSFLFEVRVGPGKLLLSTLNIRQNLDEAYPEAVYFLDRLLRYTTSQEFEPVDVMPLELYGALVAPSMYRVHSA